MRFLMRIAIHGIKDRAITQKLQEAMTGNFQSERLVYNLLIDRQSIDHHGLSSFRNGKIIPGGKHGCRFPHTCMVRVF